MEASDLAGAGNQASAVAITSRSKTPFYILLSLISMALPLLMSECDGSATVKQLARQQKATAANPATPTAVVVVDHKDDATSMMAPDVQYMTNAHTRWPKNRTIPADPMIPFLQIQSQQRRQLQESLAEESMAWRIGEEPIFEYADSQFSLEWEVSDFIPDAHATFTVYSGLGCKEGGENDITSAINDFYAKDSSAYLQNFGLQPDPNTPYNPASMGDGLRKMRMFMGVQPTAANAPVFHYMGEKDSQKARIDFCVRFSLYTGDFESKESIEVNFHETQVTFFADLTDGFEVGDVLVKNKDQIQRAASIQCEIIAYECDRQNVRLENPGYLRNQGKEVRVCVELSKESKAQGLLLDRIHWFYWILENEYQTVRQNAIVFDAKESPDTLTEYSCMRGADLCPFNTILKADFYQWANVIHYVRGIGEGVCRLGARSFLAEDVPKNIGDDIMEWLAMDKDVSPMVEFVTFTDIPAGFSVSFTDTDGSKVSETIPDDSYNFTISGDENALRASIDTITLLTPMHSDDNFTMSYYVGTASGYVHKFIHPVGVFAIADPPAIDATESILIDEDSDPFVLQITVGKSEDVDNSEYLSVRISVQPDGFGPVGSITAPTIPEGVSFQTQTAGQYLITAEGDTPDQRETKLNQLLTKGLFFEPRPHFSGVLEQAIRIDAISSEQGTQIAPADSAEWGTLGNLDPKNAMATTYTAVTIAPINDIPYLQNDQSYVTENNLNSDVDEETDVAIGQAMGMTVDDTDGSQYLDVVISGFPTNVIRLYFAEELRSVAASIDKERGTVTLSGGNSTEVLAVLETLVAVLAHDDDRNFNLTIEGTSKDSNGVVEVVDSYSLSHTVIVGAVADTPTLDIGAKVKALVVEGSTANTYPVTIGLNDRDGSETYQGSSVYFDVSFPIDIANGAPPKIQFGKPGGTSLSTTGPPNAQRYTLTGSTDDLNAAMNTIMITPGAHNGEDIAVMFTVIAVESNPSETGPGEVAVEKVEVVDVFTIPVDPVILGKPKITIPSESVTGLEDSKTDLGTINVELEGTEDPDGSEVYFLEIDTSSFTGFEYSRWWVDNAELEWHNYVLDGWLRLPNSESALISVRGPGHFSGELPLAVRGTIVDFSMSGQAVKSTDPQTITVNVMPVADDIRTPNPPNTVGIEDAGPVAFGADVASGVRVKDNGNTRKGNNPETETISKVAMQLPPDTSSLTYKVTAGSYLPESYSISGGIFIADKTAKIYYDPNFRRFEIFSTIITEAADIGAIDINYRKAASNHILAALSTFEVKIGPEHSDADGVINCVVTTLDVNVGSHSEKDNAFDHNIIILAVADKPGIFTHTTEAVDEDSSNIPFRFNVTNSADRDNSEALSVRIIVPKENGLVVGTIEVDGDIPSGVTLTKEDSAKYLVEATGSTWSEIESKLNGFVDSGKLRFLPRLNWAGTTQIQVDVISTEMGNDNEIASGIYGGDDNDSRTETTTGFIDIVVNPIADAPIVSHTKGSAIGLEDEPILIAVSITLGDQDGSETFVMTILEDSLPAGCTVYGANAREISPKNGMFTLQPDDVDELRLRPPLHYSTAYQPAINMATRIVVSDGDSTYTLDLEIPVKVIGVSDKPLKKDILVVANEDEEYPIGQAIASKLDGVLVDDDGSETLYLVLGGISSRTKLLGVDESSMLYLGNGEWSIEASAVAALTVTPVKNYSGQNPFPFMTLTAISQEVDGDQSSSDLWTITFDVLPVIDGFKDWAPAVTVTEEDNEINNVGISLAAARDYTLEDSDGSEKVINFKFDLSNVLESAGIDDQLKVLSGNTSSDVSNLVDTYIAGVFEFDGSIITVLPENVAGVTIAAQLFKDSNQDFAIPVTALVEDSATINGSQEVVSKIESTELKVNLVGTADVPTVSAGDIVGCQRIQMDIGGETTDTDVELGRSQSESIAYLIQPINMRSLPGYRIVDSAQNNIGFAAGAMTWILPYDEMKEAEENGGLFFYTIDQGEYITRRLQNDTAAPVSAPTPTPAPIPAEFKLWVIAKENDGDEAFDTANFYVTYWQGECDGGFDDPVAPLPPILSIGPNNGVEDTDLSLSISATPDPADTTNPTVSIVLSNIPEGFTIAGKVIPGFYYNHATGTHSAYADYFAVGNVVITPPKDFAGTVSIQAEAIAVNSFFISNSSGEQSASLTFDPVADGVAITIPGIENGGVEMQQLPLPIELALLDTDGSERLGDAVFVEVCFDATLMPQYTRVQPQDGDASVAGVSVAGYYRVPVGEVNGLSMQPSDYWHGPCDVSVVAVSIENDDDEDGDHIMMATEMTFTPYIVSVPTPPLVNVPDTVSGEEDTAIFLPGLSASLVDTVDINGKERLSAIISNVPLNSIFNHGSNSGEGRWAIPTDKLGGLYITPPPQYAGTFQMTLTAVAFDVATGTEASTSADMVITVKPVADTFLMLAKNIDVVQGAVSGVFLTIHMDDTTGSLEGELPPEILHLTFNDVPTGVWFQASAGGTMTDNGIYWNFEGSEDEANSIVVHTSADTPIDIHNITVFGFTQDGDSTLQKNVRDSFLVRVLNPASAGRALQRQNHYGAPSPWQRSLGSRSGCGAETSIVWESQPGLITLDDYPVTIDVQGNTSVTFTLDSSSLLRSSVSNWAAIMYPSTPHGKTVCEAVAIDLESKYQGNCYNGGSTAYLLVNAKGAPDSADNAYIPTTCKGLYPKPDAKTVMVELSIPCHPCSAQDEFGTTTNNGMFGGESGNNGNVGDGFDDDSFTDDALYDDDGLEELEDGFLEDVEDVEFSKRQRQRLRWLQQEDLQVNEDGTVVWTEQDAMVPATLDRDTLKLLMQSKNPKYRSLQEEQQQQQEEQGADGSSSSDADTLGGTSKISLNLELVGGDGILRQQKSGAASTRSTTFVGWWWTIASVVVSTTVCCLFSAILL